MPSTVSCAVILLAVLTFSAAQSSCKGRCGAEYYRGYMCQCDYSCLPYGECCKDYESQCTTKNSCKGRCGEIFKRGRLCSCDSECMKYKQCCPDYESHCDAEVTATEEISGAASATAPMKTSSCDNVNDNKPKEAVGQPSTFSEGNDPDDLITLVNPTSYPPHDVSNDNSKTFPSDDPSNSGVEEPQVAPTPEINSGYGSTVGQLDQVTTEPSLEFSTDTIIVATQTEKTPSTIEPTQADDSPSILYTAHGEGLPESTDAIDLVTSTISGTTVPQPTTAVHHVSSQPVPTSAAQTPTASASTTELESSGQAPEDDIFPEALKENPTDKPEVTTPPVNTAFYSSEASVTTELTLNYTVLETTQATTTPALSSDLILNPEATTSNPEPDNSKEATDATTGLPSDLSMSVTPVGNLAELTPSSTAAVKDDNRANVTPQTTTDDPVKVTSDLPKPQPSEATSKPHDNPAPYKPLPTKPTSKPETKPLDTEQSLHADDPRDYQADDSNDTNLCSGRPVSAVTTLRNGTIVVFRGHYFWFLDSNSVPGPARGITQVWGIPSPIDTVFTRCNCQGKTYIFKGAQYWRFENGVLDSGYPKVIETGFGGLQGHITAALSVPQYQRRRESVYFFKRGGFVQKYSYQFGISPTCGKKVKYDIFTARNRMARQAVSLLEPVINIHKSWRGFPSTITAAVSVPNNREPDGYKYYVFSRSKSYNVRMDGEHPVIAAPNANTSPQSNNVFKCPKRV